MTTIIRIPLILLALCITNATQAASDKQHLFGLGIAFNTGERLATIDGRATFVGGTFGVFYGQAISLNKYFEAEGHIGFRESGDLFGNPRISFYTFPVDVLVFSKLGKLRAGAGLTYHLFPRYQIKVQNDADGTLEFNSPLGFQLQLDYALSEHHRLALRYEKISYGSDEQLYWHDEYGGRQPVDEISGTNTSLVFQHNF